MALLRPLVMLACLLLACAAGAREQPDSFWYDTAADGGPVVKLHFFWTPTCPHCRAAMPFVESLPERLPWVEVVTHPLKDNRANARLYYETAKSIGADASSVPGFLFCRRAEIGYDAAETTGEYLVRQLEACRAQRALAGPVGAAAPVAGPAGGAAAAGVDRVLAGGALPPVQLPLVGTVDVGAWSLPALTVTLAGVDAFNPCAFFVLLFLLSMLVHARSRPRMLLVGGTFVLFSGLVYFAFMAAWLNVFMLAGEIRVLTVAAALVALLVGLFNVKDYFWFRQGPSLSIPEDAKPGLFRRMRALAGAQSLPALLAGTVVLALVVNSYELLCTIGFPLVFTRTLTLHDLPVSTYYAYLALYNVVYVLPMLAIVLAFTWTLGSRKLTEAEGRGLKLVSGYMMLAFGAVLLMAPQLLVNAVVSIGVLLAAVAAAVVTSLAHRRLAAAPPRSGARA